MRVWKNAGYKSKTTKEDDGFVVLEFSVEGANVANPVQNTHWIQFYTDHRILDGGKEFAGGSRDFQRIWHPTFGANDTPQCDAGKDKDKPFFDQVFIARRTNTEISIFDKPTAVPVVGRNCTSGHVDFDSYLVDDGKVLYHVRWEIHTTLKGKDEEVVEVKNISGEPTDRFASPKLWGDNLLVGYDKPGKVLGSFEGPITVVNPIPKETRDRWKK